MRSLGMLAALCAASCGSAVAMPITAQARSASVVRRPIVPLGRVRPDRWGPATHLRHIVLVIQENRTTDNLFNGFCLTNGQCADTVTVDPATGQPLVPRSFRSPYSPNHDHGQFVTQYDYGKMDGWSNSNMTCGGPQPCPHSVFAYVPAFETSTYRKLATVEGVLSDETFQSNQGPSLPAHLYAIAGQAGGYDGDHWAILNGYGNCGTTQPLSQQILMTTPFPGQQGNYVPPCKDFLTIFDLLTSAGRTWRYYANQPDGFWAGPQNIAHLYNSPNFIVPPTQFQKDVAAGHLADVTYVIPPGQDSDHAGMITHAEWGPKWVASVVDAIGRTPFWNDTAIVIWWDDWGGWYDHVAPPASPLSPDPVEYGFRVPLIVVSPYARLGTIDHTQRTFVSALRLIEDTFGLPSLGTMDKYEPDGLEPLFDFRQKRIPFTPLPT